MIIVLVREWFTLKFFVGDGVVWDENIVSNFCKLRMKKSRFVLKNKGFIFCAIVKGEGEC